MRGSQLRAGFLKFFEERGHSIVSSSSLVPKEDPTLLFTNAGMVQFKDAFLDKKDLGFRRAASSQKCMRVSGKHNDLETVGRTARHHTFFEMLGNFSFGDYFKEGAIAFAWEFLTEVLGLSKERLWITVYQEDDEASDIWHERIGIPRQRIVRLGEKDNFWAMGEVGPCGPCSEIHLDQGERVGCGEPSCGVDCDCDRFLELWNLVFMQYARNGSGQLNPLPKPSVDTGMGLERMTAVMQGVTSNYESDLLRPIIAHLEEIAGKKYGCREDDNISFRVIADHLRANAFLVADGVLPSNEGRGYVLRRLIRRAARHGRMLEIKEPFLHRAVATVIECMGNIYPELELSRSHVGRVLLNEEERFSRTLEYGLEVLSGVIEQARRKGQTVLPGQEVFKLYDTYGFPLDLAQEIAQDDGFSLELEEFRQAMEQQREMARQSWKGAGEEATRPFYQEMVREIDETSFLGYETIETRSRVRALLVAEKRQREVEAGKEVEVILDRTPFYGESGGQLGDIGLLGDEEGGVLMEVKDTQKPLPSLTCHRGVLLKGTLLEGQVLLAQVDPSRRRAITHSHSATHLLHEALRQVLGDHVKQAGSLVAPDRLRFDFTHFSPLTPHELEEIEVLVNEKVWENLSVSTDVIPLEEAIQKGARALFGEKYESVVRVVRMGEFSREVCGGTHVTSSGQISFFKITQENGIAAGVRRIEALTAREAFRHIRREESTLREIREITKARPFQEAERVRRLWEQSREQEKEVASLRDKLAGRAIDLVGRGKDTSDEGTRNVKGVRVLCIQVDHVDINALRSFVDRAKAKLGSGVVVAGTVVDQKVALVGGVTEDLTDRIHSGNLLKAVAKVVGGSGGGRADLAQAGGKDVKRLPEALENVYALVEAMLP